VIFLSFCRAAGSIAGRKVKVGRKVYIKINSSGFSSVKVPDLIEKRIVKQFPP
jgi:hypothetical protein